MDNPRHRPKRVNRNKRAARNNQHELEASGDILGKRTIRSMSAHGRIRKNSEESEMEINRNQYFMAGIVILLFGIQVRMVDAYVLTPEATQFVVKRFHKPKSEGAASPAAFEPVAVSAGPALSMKTITVPPWGGWASISLGSVLILHSLAMKRPN
jgi:hypothetical protein